MTDREDEERDRRKRKDRSIPWITEGGEGNTKRKESREVDRSE